MTNAWLLLGMAIGSGAMAADPATMQPGQWDYTVKMEMPGMPFAMPPQSFQHCLTQADVDMNRQGQAMAMNMSARRAGECKK